LTGNNFKWGGTLVDATTSIAMAGNNIQWSSSGNLQLTMNPTTNVYKFGDIDAAGGYGFGLSLDGANSKAIFGTLANNSNLEVNESTATITLRISGSTYLQLVDASTYKLGDIDAGSGNETVLTVDDANQRITVNRRFEMQQGADVASVAGAITLGADGNIFEITGTNAITLFSNVSWVNGSVIHLVFTSTASLTDGTANSGTDIGMELAGGANFTGSADDVVTLVLSEMGGTQRWREVSRSVN